VVHGSRAAAAAALVALSFGSGRASAYCRTTTCDVTNANASACTADAKGCATAGLPLYWPGGCSWFGVQKDGSAKRKISYDTFHGLVAGAFDKWAAVDCGSGRHPSFAAEDTDVLYGSAVCAEPEFNNDTRVANASVWMFRDSSWPYQGATSTIALTTLTVDTKTGQILDADVEVNSFAAQITTTGPPVADLDSIVTHESGHFLGLAHSSVKSATMYYQYSPASTSIRAPGSDDIAGICAIYPPTPSAPACVEPEPMYGFSRYCGGVNPSTKPVAQSAPATRSGGCALASGGTRSASAGFALGVALAFALGSRRSRRHRPS
jgi:hypothetical protein